MYLRRRSSFLRVESGVFSLIFFSDVRFFILLLFVVFKLIFDCGSFFFRVLMRIRWAFSVISLR